MPAREIVVKFSLEGLVDASTQARGFAGDLSGLGGAAADAATKAVPLTDAIDKTATAAAAAAPAVKAVSSAATEAASALREQLAPAGAAAQAAFEKLGNVTGIRGLSVAIVQSTIVMDAFKKSTQDAEAAGTKMPPAVGAALQAMQSQIDGATAKLGGLKAGMSEVQTRSIAMGESWRQAATAGGSLNSMLFNLAEGSTGTAAALAKTGLTAFGAFAAFEVGMKIGTELDKVLKEVGIDFSRLGEPINFASNAVAGMSAQLAKTGIGGAAFVKWANEAKAAMSAYAGELGPLTGKMNVLMEVHQKAALQLQEDIKTLKGLGLAWVDPITQAGNFAKELATLDDAIHQNLLEGAKLSDIAESNAAALTKVRHELDLKGLSLSAVSPKLAQLIVLNETWVTATAAAATKLEALRAKLDILTPSLDTVDSGLKRQVVTLGLLVTAAEKKAASDDKFMSVLDKQDAALTKITDTLRKELLAAQDSNNVVENSEKAYTKASVSIEEYGQAHNLTTAQVLSMIKTQETTIERLNTLAKGALPDAVTGLKALGTTFDEVAAKSESFTQSLERQEAATRKSIAAFDAETQFIKNRNAAIVTGTEVIDAHGNATETAQNKEGKWEPIWLKVTAATEAQNKALMDLLKTTNAYTDSLDKTLTVASGWKDYLAQLVDAYQSGSTSLLAYKNALAEFQTQLLQLFGGATGKAKTAIEDITRAVQNLINTAGAGGPVSMDWSVQGVLDKTFNKPPVKP